MPLKPSIRLQKHDGSWKAFACEVIERANGSATIRVPDLHSEWVITPGGMVGNVGGNDWRIYELHPDDCKKLCTP
jgi:hypothetical protein